MALGDGIGRNKGVKYWKDSRQNNYVRTIQIVEGLKVFMPNEKSCYELEKQLNTIGIKTRVGKNCEADIWSIYIISVPDNIQDTCTTV